MIALREAPIRLKAHMAYWLFKTEPETWSWDQQVARGAKGEPWNGVRNFQANSNMKKMKKGDLGFFYHSGEERQIVGIVEVLKEHEKDPTDETGRFSLVTVKAIKPLERPFTLAEAKGDPKLAEMVLVRSSRLSVQPVSPEEWAYICRRTGTQD